MTTVLALLIAIVVVAGADPSRTEEQLAIEEKWDALHNEAYEQAQGGHMDEAIATCRAALEVQDHASSHHLLSQLFLATDQRKDALHHISKAAELKPESTTLKSEVKFHEGVLEQGLGHYPEAFALYKVAADIAEVDDVRALEKVTLAMASLGDIPSAVEQLHRIWAVNPQHSFHNNMPFVRLADAYERDLEEARKRGDVDATVRRLKNITVITERVFFDLKIGEKEAQRVVFGMYGVATPRAVANFEAMAACEDPKLCYKGTLFHRVVEGFVAQGGDVVTGDGSTSANIYGRPFADEVYGLVLMHNEAGVLEVANNGPDTNGGQFVVMAVNAPHLNGNHVVMGKVLEGLEVMTEIDALEVSNIFLPTKPVLVEDCGLLGV